MFSPDLNSKAVPGRNIEISEKFKLNFLKRRSFMVIGFRFLAPKQIKALTSSSDLRIIESIECRDF